MNENRAITPMRQRFSVEEAGQINTNPPELGFWALVAEDYRTHGRDLFSQGFWAIFWHRFGNWRMSIPWRPLRLPFSMIYRVMYKLTQWICGIDLPYTVILGRRVKIEHFGGAILVAERIGNDVIIRHNTTFGITGLNNPFGRPSIGDGVDIGAGAAILGAITIGADAVIGANAVVVRSVEPGDVVGGVPAQSLLDKPSPDTKEPVERHG